MRAYCDVPAHGVAKIEHADVAEWVAGFGQEAGPDLVRYAHRVLCLVLDHAMRGRRVSTNVARGYGCRGVRPLERGS